MHTTNAVCWFSFEILETWLVCLQNNKNCCHIKHDSLQQAGGRQFANRLVPVRIYCTAFEWLQECFGMSKNGNTTEFSKHLPHPVVILKVHRSNFKAVQDKYKSQQVFWDKLNLTYGKSINLARGKKGVFLFYQHNYIRWNFSSKFSFTLFWSICVMKRFDTKAVHTMLVKWTHGECSTFLILFFLLGLML